MIVYLSIRQEYGSSAFMFYREERNHNAVALRHLREPCFKISINVYYIQ